MTYLDKFQEIAKETRLSSKEEGLLIGYEKIVATLVKVFLKQKEKSGNCVYFIGNGGSAAIAIHMTADYLKNGSISTVSMYDPATLTCLGNDYGYEHIFSKQLEMLAHPGDVLVAISSSGNSQNIINAIKYAQEKQIQVITLTGFKETNQAAQLGDYNIYVPCSEYGIVESLHNMILQHVVDEVVVSSAK